MSDAEFAPEQSSSRENFRRKYHYNIIVRRIPEDATSDKPFAADLTQHCSMVGFPCESRQAVVERLQSALATRGSRPVNVPSTPGKTVGPVPVTLATVHVEDNAGLSLTAADLVDGQSQLADYEHDHDGAADARGESEC